MEPTWPLEMLSTMILTEKDGKTTAILTAVAYNATDTERATFEAGLDGMDEGFTGTLDQLDAYLAKAQGQEEAYAKD